MSVEDRQSRGGRKSTGKHGRECQVALDLVKIPGLRLELSGGVLAYLICVRPGAPVPVLQKQSKIRPRDGVGMA